MEGGSMDDDAVLARITESGVGRALDGFRLDPTVTFEQLAKAIKEALRVSLMMSRDVSWRTSADFNRRGPRGGPSRQSNAATKQELAALAKQSADLARHLRERSKEADVVLWMHAFWNNPGEGKEQPSDYERFLEIVQQLEWMSAFLGNAAQGLKGQSPRWVEAERQEQRIFHAHALSDVYEWAFNKKAAAVSWEQDAGGPWPDFFRRIMKLAFGVLVPNAEKVLKAARDRHKNSGVLFDPRSLSE